MQKPTIRNVVVYLCVTSFVLLIIHHILAVSFGVPKLVMGELIWLVLSPALVSKLYERRHKEKISFENAEKISLYYVPIMLIVGLIGLVLYLLTQNPAVLEKLKTHYVFIAILALLYFGAILIFGRWGVSAILSHDPKKKHEP